jgi:hypothetical protein
VGPVVGCSSPAVVNTGEPPATSLSSAAPPPPALRNRGLVNAFDFVAHVDGKAGYYFTTPSGRWECAIRTRERAGCQSTSGWPAAMGLPGQPKSVTSATGEPGPANAIVVDKSGDAHFASLEEPEFALDPGPATVLQFDQTLAAAGFRCNVQEAGVSCMSERTGRGFTFSAEGFQLTYTDLPPA